MKDEIKGTILFVFERGEENGKGIYRILSRLVEIGADGIWGIHLKSDIPSGKISVDPGPRMSGVFPFHIKIKGKSGHGSRPDLAISPIDCFTAFNNELKKIEHHELNPFMPITYSIGSVQAGDAANAIPDELIFRGTARFLHEEQGEQMKQSFDRLLAQTCEMYGCEFSYVEESRPLNFLVYNEENCSNIAQIAIEKSLGQDVLHNYPAWLASEPFG